VLAVFFRGTGVLGCWLINELYSTVAVKVLDGVPLLVEVRSPVEITRKTDVTRPSIQRFYSA